MNRLLRLCLALTLLGAGGCTPMQWVRDDADAARSRKDLAECGREAWLRSYDRSVYYGASGPIIVRDWQGRIAILNPYGPFSDPFLLESQLADFCMRQRGYRLVPLKPEN